MDFREAVKAVTSCAELQSVSRHARLNEAQQIVSPWWQQTGDVIFRLFFNCKDEESFLLDHTRDYLRAQCLLKLVRIASPLHGLYNEMRLVLVNHRRLKGMPPRLPHGIHQTNFEKFLMHHQGPQGAKFGSLSPRPNLKK